MTVTRTRALARLGAALSLAVVLAACGGGSSSTPTNTSAAAGTSTTPAAGGAGVAGGATRRVALAACLKKYGVTLPTRGLGGPRFGVTGGSGPFRRFGATGATGATGRFFGATGRLGAGVPGRGFPGGGGLAANPKFAAAIARCGGFAGGFGGRFGATGATGARGFNNVASPQYRAEITSYAVCMKRDGVQLPSPNFSGVGFVFGTKVNRTAAAFVAANAKCVGLLSSLGSPANGGARGTGAGTGA